MTPGLISTRLGAPYSHISSHLPQAMHLSSSTVLTTPSASMNSLERTVFTRAAAARAWETLSPIRRGECASPQRNMPSVAKSTGLSFMCASRKNPSLFSGTLSIFASSWLSGFGCTAAFRTM